MRFDKSNEWLGRAKRVIPVASQTFSKSPIYYPIGASPLTISHGKGSHVWDLDKNEYVDFVCGLGPITLGYCYPAVDRAIQEQLKKGIIFSLPSELEAEMAELLHDKIPFAEMSRFMKTGSEACQAAVRIARAFTGRDLVLSCGYHGWHSEFSCITERKKGIPLQFAYSIEEFPYNDIDNLRALFDLNMDSVACVIMEPTIVQKPKQRYLRTVKQLCEQNGSLLIFDETVTGGRFPPLTASQYFKVQPDLIVLGKGLANGMPLAAVCGRKDIMREFEDVMVSGTFHGECLSLAAGLATIKEITEKNTIEYCWKIGQLIIDELGERDIKVDGYPCRPMIVLPDTSPEAKTLFLEQMIQREILIVNSLVLNICYSHSWEDADKLIDACTESVKILEKAIAEGTVREQCRGKIVSSAFRRI